MALWPYHLPPGSPVVVGPELLARLFRSSVFGFRSLAKSDSSENHTAKTFHLGIADHFGFSGHVSRRDLWRRTIPLACVVDFSDLWPGDFFSRMGHIPRGSLPFVFPGFDGSNSGNCFQPDYVAFADLGLEVGGM